MTNTAQLSNSSHPRRQAKGPSGAAKRLLRWSALGLVFALSACAGMGPERSPQEQVTERANARWKALVAKNIDGAYAYTTPSFRALVTSDAYRARFGTAVTWIGAEVVRVNCPDAVKCDVVVRLDFLPLLGAKNGEKISTHLDETWVPDAGQWWIFESIKGN